jgi:hypothetical protein
MQNGLMYSWDNGPNSGWGGAPGNCKNNVSEPGSTQHDALHLIDGEGYYAGHPNPTRGSKKNTFNKSKPQSPVSGSNPIECDYYGPGANGNGVHPQNEMLSTLPRSTNGLAEYTASNFNGKMQGNLLVASWDNKIYRVAFDGAGGVDEFDAIFSNVGDKPLDVPALSDSDIDIYAGIGGAPEGVLSAAALRCLGGDIQSRIWPRDEEERQSLIAEGWEDRFGKVYFASDLARGRDILFCATGINESPLLKGVRVRKNVAISHSVLMRVYSGTVRFLSTETNLNTKTMRLRSTQRAMKLSVGHGGCFFPGIADDDEHFTDSSNRYSV